MGLFGSQPINTPWLIIHFKLLHRNVNKKQKKQFYRPCEELSAACGLQLFDWSEEYLPWRCTEVVWWARGNWYCWMDRYHPGIGPCTQTWPWRIHARRVWNSKTADAAAASDRQAGRQEGWQPPRAENRSPAAVKILLVLDRLHSLHAGAKESGEWTRHLRSKDPGYLKSERRGNEPGGRVRGHCGRLMRWGATADGTATLGAWSEWAMRRGSLLKQGDSSQTPTRRTRVRPRRTRPRHLVVKRRSTEVC